MRPLARHTCRWGPLLIGIRGATFFAAAASAPLASVAPGLGSLIWLEPDCVQVLPVWGVGQLAQAKAANNDDWHNDPAPFVGPSRQLAGCDSCALYCAREKSPDKRAGGAHNLSFHFGRPIGQPRAQSSLLQIMSIKPVERLPGRSVEKRLGLVARRPF